MPPKLFKRGLEESPVLPPAGLCYLVLALSGISVKLYQLPEWFLQVAFHNIQPASRTIQLSG